MTQENFIKHQKVSKYDHDCLKNFILLFLSLLTASIVKNSHFFWLEFTSQAKVQRLLIPSFDLSSEKSLSSKKIFCTFLQISCYNFKLKLLKALELPKLLNKSNLKGAGASGEQSTVCGDSPGQNISDKLVLCEIVPYGKGSIFIFLGFFASIGKI